MKLFHLSCYLVPVSALLSGLSASAQQISGFSTITIVPPTKLNCVLRPTPEVSGSLLTQPPVIYCPPGTPPPQLNTVVEPYADTTEDYTASLYYNVTSTSKLYYDNSSTPLTSGTGTGNPTAAGYYNYDSPQAGIYTEITGHYLDFFYSPSAGGYYDPYGFSVINGNTTGDTDSSAYWLSVFVYGTYLAEASVLLGESNDSESYNTNYQGASIQNLAYQTFIPANNVTGTPPIKDPGCVHSVYAGDNRIDSGGSPIFIPSVGSYRGLEDASVGVGGLTTVNAGNAPPIVSTGYTFSFNAAVLENGLIPDTAYNYDYIGQCNAATIDEYGHASASNVVAPIVSYSGPNSTSITFQGQIGNPVEAGIANITWIIPITLTEPTASNLHVSGSFNVTCYPAHELSVGGKDVEQYSPTSNNLVYIASCLNGFTPVNRTISADIPLVAAP